MDIPSRAEGAEGRPEAESCCSSPLSSEGRTVLPRVFCSLYLLHLSIVFGRSWKGLKGRKEAIEISHGALKWLSVRAPADFNNARGEVLLGTFLVHTAASVCFSMISRFLPGVDLSTLFCQGAFLHFVFPSFGQRGGGTPFSFASSFFATLSHQSESVAIDRRID